MHLLNLAGHVCNQISVKIKRNNVLFKYYHQAHQYFVKEQAVLAKYKQQEEEKNL